MNETKIEWCDYSANLLKYRDADGKSVWACAKVSDGCKNCYAETLAHRYRRGGPYTLQQVRKVTPFFDDKEAGTILRAKKLAGKRVFVDDMTDLFGEWVPDEIIDKHFALFALRPDVTFQVLTKRPELAAKYTAATYLPGGVLVAMENIAGDRACEFMGAGWPLPNVWLGTSCENQQTADERIPHLLKCPAAVRFISAEPLLGPIDLETYFSSLEETGDYLPTGDARCEYTTGIDWVIIGGESGHSARPCDIDWVRSIVRQCDDADVACFVKQLGAKPFDVDRRRHATDRRNIPLDLDSSKGGDPSEWPADLRVRQMPEPEAQPCR